MPLVKRPEFPGGNRLRAAYRVKFSTVVGVKATGGLVSIIFDPSKAHVVEWQ